MSALWQVGSGPAVAQTAGYPNPAPIADYRFADQAEEIAMARGAAPPSISDHAEILTLGANGYETAIKGGNGFVCLVQRAWANEPDNAEFWNPKMRAPLCLNPAAVRSVLPTYVERTKWVLAGASKADIVQRTKAAIAAGRIRSPEAGAMSYMMSKAGYLNDSAGGPWHPHVMMFVPRNTAYPADWGANLSGSPVVANGGAALDPAAVYYIPVAKWSDGSSEAMACSQAAGGEAVKTAAGLIPDRTRSDLKGEASRSTGNLADMKSRDHPDGVTPMPARPPASAAM